MSSVVPQQGGASALVTVVKKHPRRFSIGILWLFGLFAVFFAPAPVKLTGEKIEAFQAEMKRVESVDSRLYDAHRVYQAAESEQARHKVWFWRFRKEHRDLVKEHQPAVDEAYKNVRLLGKEREKYMRKAKRTLGVWSDAGVEESRALLWKSFESGKVFAQRQTFWDSLFTILNSRDRDWISLLLNLLLTALVNYTVGSVMAVITFVFQLPSFLASYSPGIVSGTLFFFVASVAAVALIASYLSLIYASGAAVVYSTAAFVDLQRRRIAYEQQQRLRGQRPHYE